MADEMLVKLLNLAITPGTPEHEADCAMRHFIKRCQKLKITAVELLSTAPDSSSPEPVSLRMPFGKYRGVSIDEVLRIDPNYCLWAAENADRLPSTIKKYIFQRLSRYR